MLRNSRLHHRTKVVSLLIALTGVHCAKADAPTQGEMQVLSAALPLINARQWHDAEVKLNDGLVNFPESAVLSNALGMVYQEESKTEEAIRAFENAVGWLPNFTAAQLHLGSLLLQKGDCGRADSLLVSAVEHTSDTGALETAGIGLAQCKDYASAVRVLEKAHTGNPQSSAVTFNLALARFEHGEYKPALDGLDSLSSSADSTRPEVFFLRGKILQSLHEPGAAAALSSACTQRAEEDYCNDAATELIREEHFGDACDLLQRSSEALPASATLLSTLGLAQFRLGRYRDATASYSKSIKLDPKGDASREGLGFLLYMTGDLEQARAVIEEGLAKQNPDFYLPYLRALVLYRMGRQFWPEALPSLESAMKSNPKFAPSYFLRGKISMEQNSSQSALADFETAVRLDPKYALPYYKLAQIYLRQGQAEKAAEARQQFAALGSLREEEVLARQTQNQVLSSR